MELMDLLIYQIGNEILLGFPWTVFLDPLEKYLSFYPYPLEFSASGPLTPWNFQWPSMGGKVWIFPGTTHWSSGSDGNETASFHWKSSIAGLSAVRKTETAEKKIRTVQRVFCDSAEVYIRQ